MMSGYPDRHQSQARPHPARAYGVIERDGGWCVVVEDCATRPFRDREAALRIARQLQDQADRLNHVDAETRRSA
ncbi:hypothetical protein ABIE19_002097 [Brevundimonas faecalis]|uniref:DUF2188 domain-containing protein n=2 Tax=Brevundimonas faecalis TaxID=947378 RepID=A0ABV2RC94_9CAUL